MSDRRSPDPAREGVILVLVGLMGAGKSTVGRRLARRCGRRFVDLDDEIVRRTGRTVPRLFAQLGESGFRDLEARTSRAVAAEAADRPGLIVAAGGGWMANPQARAALPAARTVWLKVGPAEAARRLGGGRSTRPLLSDGDVVGRLEALLAERLPAYGEATYTVETEGRAPEGVARDIAALVGLPFEADTSRTDYPHIDDD